MSLVKFCNSILQGQERCNVDLGEKPIGLRFRFAFELSIQDALLCFKLIRKDQVGVTQQVLVNGYNVFTNVESSLIAHDRIEYCQF